MNRSVETIRVDPARGAARAALARPLAALSASEWIGWPSETLYGLATRADSSQALTQLRALAAAGVEERLTWLIASNSELERLAPVRPVVQRLVERYWPGPLTLSLRGRVREASSAESDGWTCVRRPAHAVAQALLEAAEVPIVSADGSVRGAPAVADAAGLLERFSEHVKCVVDAGPSKLREPPTILAVGPGRFELVREGIIDLAALRAAAGLRLGFVCTGNTCRSPMAEALARAALAKRLSVSPSQIGAFGFSVTSMGVYAAPGAPASAHSVGVLAERGLDLSEHRSQAALPEQLARLDRVYALTSSHLEALTQLLPPGRSRHCMLLDPKGRDIADPIGGPRSEYAVVAAQIEEALALRLDEWA